MHTAATLQALIDGAVAEAQTLEFKQKQELKERPQKGELLKDLTGMANGGGGSIFYGIREDEEGHNSAAGIDPIEDRGFPGQIENIVRDGVSPPLLYRLYEVEVDSGFVLVVEVDPSQLGPYMVTRYDKTEHRYFKRHGRRVDMMSEQEVRDAYALAMRAAERRPVVWNDHRLPIMFNDGGRSPRVVVSAVPLEPLGELLDLRKVVDRDVAPPPFLLKFMADACSVGRAMNLANRWADGFVGQVTSSMGRIHRDGAAGLSQDLLKDITPPELARVVDAMLAYLGWLYVAFHLRRPVEVLVEVTGLHDLELVVRRAPTRHALAEAPGIDVPAIGVMREVEPEQLYRASGRHQIVRDTADRFVQAFGLDRVEMPFVCGPLYGPDHKSVGAALEPSLMGIWRDGGSSQLGTLDPTGIVKSSASGRVLAYWDDGVVTDLDGNTLGFVELAVGGGIPDEYFPQERAVDEFEGRSAISDNNVPAAERPGPTGRWSSLNLQTLLEDVGGLAEANA